MSEQQNSYLPQGSGPHPTMAGNLFDPKVNADGQKGGIGVGGTSEQNIRQEGAEHISNRGQQSGGFGTDQYDTGVTGQQSGLGGSSYDNNTVGGQSGRGSSNYDNNTIGGQSTGLGQSQFDQSSTGRQGNLDGTVGGTQSSYDEPSSRQQHSEGTSYLKEAAGLGAGAGGASALNSRSTDTDTSRSDNYRGTDGSTQGGYQGSSNTSGQDFVGTGGRDETTTSSTRDPLSNTASNAGRPVDSDPTTDSSTSTADRTGTDDTATTGGTSGRKQKDDEYTKGGPPPSIPDAGGERIGTKHWGESKVIPEVPPRRESQTGSAGVSSAAGQSDDLTKQNTASNTGAVHSDSTTGKESVVDKIKDKLHMSHK